LDYSKFHVKSSYLLNETYCTFSAVEDLMFFVKLLTRDGRGQQEQRVFRNALQAAQSVFLIPGTYYISKSTPLGISYRGPTKKGTREYRR